MSRDVDLGAVIVGLLFAVTGALFVLEDAAQIDVRLAWLAPPVLIGLGVASFASSARSRDVQPPAAEPPADPPLANVPDGQLS